MNTTARLAAFRWEVEWGLLMSPTFLLDTLSTKSGKSIQLHRRYIDSIVGAASCRREELEAFINFVANEGSSISEIELPFLDITYTFLMVQTSVYYQNTHSHNYLHFSSFHLHYCKRSIPYSQFRHLRRLCTSLCDQGDGFTLPTVVILFHLLKTIYSG